MGLHFCGACFSAPCHHGSFTLKNNASWHGTMTTYCLPMSYLLRTPAWPCLQSQAQTHAPPHSPAHCAKPSWTSSHHMCCLTPTCLTTPSCMPAQSSLRCVDTAGEGQAPGLRGSVAGLCNRQDHLTLESGGTAEQNSYIIAVCTRHVLLEFVCSCAPCCDPEHIFYFSQRLDLGTPGLKTFS